MKFKLLVGFLLFIVIQSHAQQDELPFSTTDVEIGFCLKNNVPILAHVIEFDHPIIDFELHPQFDILSIQLREITNSGKYFKNKGMLVGFDPNKSEIVWTRKLKYQPYILNQRENQILWRKPGKTIFINPSTGIDQSNFNYNFYHFYPDNQAALAYAGTVKSSTLYSVDLKNGKPLWERKVKQDFGWNYLDQLNDSTILITSSGLHHVNINTGKGWEVNTKTGEKDYTGTIVANAAGVALGLLTGMFFVSTDHKTITGVVSNALQMEQSIYQANREFIAKYDELTGQELWKHEFPKNLCSKSSLFQIDSFLYMVNYGYAYHGQTPVFYGKPFIACFDASSGKTVFFKEVEAEKFAIRDFELKEDRLCLVTRNKLMEFNIQTGELIRSMNANLQPEEKIMGYLGAEVYTYMSDKSVQNNKQVNPTATFAYTNANNIHEFNLDNNTAIVNESTSFFIEKLRYQGLRFLSSTTKSLIIDADENIVAEIELSGKPILFKETLYYSKGTKFYTISLEDILSANK